MENICEWRDCKESGTFKAPLEKDNSKNYRWLCTEHIKLFNKNWNYFDGMSQNEIEMAKLLGVLLQIATEVSQRGSRNQIRLDMKGEPLELKLFVRDGQVPHLLEKRLSRVVNRKIVFG